jgi:hypothetical protein
MARFAYEPLGCFSHLHRIIRTTVVQGAPNRERIVGAPGNWPHAAIWEASSQVRERTSSLRRGERLAGAGAANRQLGLG